MSPEVMNMLSCMQLIETLKVGFFITVLVLLIVLLVKKLVR